MRQLSFFKLPLIFISVYAAISIGWILIGFIPLILHNQYNEMIPYIITSQLLDKIFLLLLVFIITVFQCNKYRLHTMDGQNLLKIIIIVAIFSVLSIVWVRSSSLVLQPAYAYLKELNLSWLIIYFYTIVKSVIHVIVLIFLFRLIAGGDVTNRESYVLDDFSGKHIYASVFSLMLLTLILLPLSANVFNFMMIMHALLAIRFSLTENIAYFILHGVILVILFNYWFIYASTRSCFKFLPTSLQVMPLIKSIALTLLFIVVLFIIAGIALGLFMLFTYAALLYSRYSILLLWAMSILYMIALCANYWALYISTRMGVRIIFGKDWPKLVQKY